MKTYLIGYDLNAPGQDYAELIKTIKSFKAWCHCLDSTWIVRSSLDAAQVRDKLLKQLDSNDELIVVDLVGNGAWYGFTTKVTKWLKSNL